MNFGFTEEQELLRKTARDFLAERSPMSRVRQALEGDASFSKTLWGEVAQLGWTGLMLPEDLLQEEIVDEDDTSDETVIAAGEDDEIDDIDAGDDEESAQLELITEEPEDEDDIAAEEDFDIDDQFELDDDVTCAA